jgi:hypothetical protein
LNAGAVSFALCLVYAYSPYFAAGDKSWVPFQASKLGAMVAGLLAPGFTIGLVGIGLHAGSSVVQFLSFPREMQAPWIGEEPWATLAFGLAGVFVLVLRFRIRQLEMERIEAQAEAEATRRLALSFLELRDLMNTPLQSIELATALLREEIDEGDPIPDLIERSSEKLRQIAEMLKRYEHAIEWPGRRGGLP